jgi:ABC-2 type transport system ATP-binding protein
MPGGMPVVDAGRARPVAELVAARREFDGVVALDDVTLSIAPGSLVGVIGPSGAGKTTAVRLLTGGLRPTSGTARVMGEDPTRLRAETRERIGFMPQNVSLYDDLTVAENLDFVGSLFGLFRPTRRRRIAAILDWLELVDARNRRASQLSGGMRRRLQLGCALIHDPQLVFLDEPTSGVDPLVRQGIWSELRRLRDAGRTLFVTTQIVTEAEECDVVALIAAGRLIACASPEALRLEAFGGELLEVETSGMVDAAGLERIPGVDEVRQLTPRQLTVVARDAASATPAVVSAVEAAGVSVTSIHTARPSFDEVFVRLVERANGIPDGAADDPTPAGAHPRRDDMSDAGAPGAGTVPGAGPAPDATAAEATAPPPGLPPGPEATDPAGQPVEVA